MQLMISQLSKLTYTLILFGVSGFVAVIGFLNPFFLLPRPRTERELSALGTPLNIMICVWVRGKKVI